MRTLLAALLLHPNQQMSVSQLTDRLWNGEAPASPRRALQTNIVRLRREVPWDGSVVTMPAGYLLRVESDDLDLLVFRRLLAEAAATTDLEREGELLRRALHLWRGPACADVSSAIIQEYDVLALTEQRLRAVERRLEVDLSLGHVDGVVAELRALTAEFPLREHFWVLLMAALHRQGRQAEALEAYHAVSHQLAHGLGIDPGVELRKIHQQILTGRGLHELLSARANLTVHGLPPAHPCSLPPDDPQFTGRDHEMTAIDDVMNGIDSAAPAAPRTIVIDGPAGIGKSALALHWSTLNAHRFPDGHLHVDLGGFGPTNPVEPVDALRVLLQSLGIPVDQIPDGTEARAAMFRLRTSGPRMLIVLDNAASSNQIRTLLPGASCLTIVTSRNQLRGLATRHAVRRVAVPRLGPSEASALLGAVIGSRIDPDSHEVRQLVELCDRTPLALRIVAEKVARLPQVDVPLLVRDLIEDENRLDAAAVDVDLVDFRTVQLWSTRSLDPQTTLLLRRLAVEVGEVFSSNTVAELTAIPPTAVRRSLDRLVAHNLLGLEGHNRYRLSPLVRVAAVDMDPSSGSLPVPVTHLTTSDPARQRREKEQPARHGHVAWLTRAATGSAGPGQVAGQRLADHDQEAEALGRTSYQAPTCRQ
ncbi:BTAD domain-containing putative transcriptional regulator [Plantactinospora sp. GCM10030261]|uniref:AfsR/SARP family transcriptional regulator n=1 Tax=Plantactinospora sp. GCM10030261 TaxID=3273420 RepID=UPI003670825B